MREWTQSVTMTPENGFAGNCWQTAVACLLDVHPDELPAQSECDLYDAKPDGTRGKWREDSPSYNDRLYSYLRKHHDLCYVELHLPAEAFALLSIREPGWHMLTGRTVRSDQYGGTRHVVVARYGEMVWDPHPSRAGLLEEIRWAFLIPFPAQWKHNEPKPCMCPKCSSTYTASSP